MPSAVTPMYRIAAQLRPQAASVMQSSASVGRFHQGSGVGPKIGG